RRPVRRFSRPENVARSPIPVQRLPTSRKRAVAVSCANHRFLDPQSSGLTAPRYKFSRDGTHRLGALEPLNTVADVGRNDIGSSGFLPGACDVCPGAPVLKVAGPDCVRCSKPRAGVKGLLPAALAGRGSFLKVQQDG